MYGEKPPLGAREIASNTLYSHVALTPGLEPRPELVKSELFNEPFLHSCSPYNNREFKLHV